MIIAVASPGCCPAVCLTRRAGVDQVEFPPVLREILQGIGLDKLEGIAGLWLNVHANYFIEASLMIAHRRATCTTE
jgi:hypothetical protein